MKNAGSLRSFAFFHVLYSRVQSSAWSLELFGQRHTMISGMCYMQAVRATLPYIRSDVPILIIFRALGLTADKDILQHVVYDFGDTAMMEALRPSLEEAFPIQSQEVTLLLAPHQGHQGRPPPGVPMLLVSSQSVRKCQVPKVQLSHHMDTITACMLPASEAVSVLSCAERQARLRRIFQTIADLSMDWCSVNGTIVRAGGAGLHRQARERAGRHEAGAGAVRTRDPAARAAAAHWHWRADRDQEGLLCRLHGAPPAAGERFALKLSPDWPCVLVREGWHGGL